MDIDIKTTVEKTSQTVEWLVDLWRNGTWTKRLIVLVIALLICKSPIPSLVKYPYILNPKYDIYYWVAIGLLVVITVIIEIRRPRVPNNPAIKVLEKNSAIRDLYAFDFDDADIFKQLQRGVILDKVTNALINPAFKFGILYGESGCGKTSFLKAGLCAALKQNEHFQAIYIKFDKAPPETYLHSALQKVLELPASPPLNSHDLLPVVLSQNKGKSIVFIFDQFEQFFLHQPQPEQRAPFIQLLASWYQTDRPVKILLGIRRDYFSYAMEIAPEINAEFEFLNQKEVFKLPNFTVTEATAVFKVLAQTADLAFDQSAVEEICRKELAKQDNLILPADIQILASVIRDLPRQGKQGFNRDTFLKVGGVEGLLNNFLKNNLEILPARKRKAVLKVLRALIDRSRNLRTGELTLNEIQNKAGDISIGDIKDALEWSADTRLICTIEDDQLHINKYQLTHEKLIPSVLALVGELSDDVEKANALLERRTNEWLGNQRLKRFLLNFGELRLIDKQKHSLAWGDSQRDKDALIAASWRRWLTNVFVYVILPVLTVAGLGMWWLSPRGQIYECKIYLNDIVKKATNDEKTSAVSQALTNSDHEHTINIQNLQITSFYQLEHLQKSIVEKIADEERKAYVLKALAEAAGSLGGKTQGLAYLTQAQTAAEKIADEERKAYVLKALAAAAGSLGGKTQSQAYLAQAQTAAEKIADERIKTDVYQALAAAAASLGGKTQGLAYLTQAQTAAEKIADEERKADVYKALAEATEFLGDKTQGLAYLTQAQTAAEKIADEERKAYVLKALAEVAEFLGDKTQGLAYLTQLQTAAEKIADEERKADVFRSMAAAAGSLGGKTQGLAYLTQAQTAAEKIDDEESKADVYKAQAEAAGSLGGKTQGLAYLTQLQTAAEKIADEESKADVFRVMAAEAGSLRGKTQGLAYLTQAQTAAEKIADEERKAYVFGVLTEAAESLGDKSQSLAYLTQAQTAADKIADERSKADVYQALAVAAGSLGDKTQRLAYLTQVQTAAEKIADERSKADVYQALAAAAGSLGGKTQGLAYLTQVQTAAEKIADERSKADVYQALAAVAGSLGGKTQGLAYLTQVQTAAEKIADERSKADVYQALAAAAGSLGDQKQAFQFSQHAVDLAKAAKFSDSSIFLYNAELNAQAGNYRDACNLAHEENIATKDALKILAVVLREYTEKHRI